MSVHLGITVDELDALTGARCAQTDPELFFPPNTGTIAFEEAAEVCYGCPVKVDCLAGARRRNEVWGVWGGVNFEKDPDAEPFDPFAVDYCGTVAGNSRHRKRGEDPCRPCKDARAAYERETRRVRIARLSSKGMTA